MAALDLTRSSIVVGTMTRAGTAAALVSLGLAAAGTLGPGRLVGIGYLGIIALAILAGGAMIARSG